MIECIRSYQVWDLGSNRKAEFMDHLRKVIFMEYVFDVLFDSVGL